MEYLRLASLFRLPFIWGKGLSESGSIDRESPGDPRRTLSGVLTEPLGSNDGGTFSFVLMAGSAQRVSKRLCRRLVRSL